MNTAFSAICPVPTALDSWLDLSGECYQLRERKWREARDERGCTGCDHGHQDPETGAIWCDEEDCFVRSQDATEWDCESWEGLL